MNGRPFNGWQREPSPTHNTAVPRRVSYTPMTECQAWAQTLDGTAGWILDF